MQMVPFFLCFFCFIIPINAMEIESHPLCFSLKNLVTCIGLHQTKKYVGLKESGAFNDKITLPEYNVKWHDQKNKKKIKKSVYTFVHELSEAIPQDLFTYINSFMDITLLKKVYARSYALYKSLSKHENGVSTLLVDQTNRVFFSGGFTSKSQPASNDIICWNLDTYDYKYTLLDHTGYITSLAIGAEPHHLLSSSFDTVKCWDTTEKNCLFSFKNDSEIYFVAWHPEKEAIVCALGNQTIQFYDINTKKNITHTFNDDNQFISDIMFDTKTNTVVSGNWDNYSIKFKTENNAHIISEHVKQIIALYKKPDSAIVYSGSHDCSIKQWTMSPYQCTKTYMGHKESVLSLTYDTSVDLLISGAKDARIKIWDPDSTECFATYAHHPNNPSCNVSALAHDVQTGAIISGSYDCSINIWKPTVHYPTALNYCNPKDWLLLENYVYTNP